MKRTWSWLMGSKAGGRRRRSTLRRKPRRSFETLEDRRLMAVTVYYDDGFRSGDYDHPELVGLHIIGTEGDDEVDVIYSRNGNIVVQVEQPDLSRPTKFAMSAAMVPQVFFDGLGGDDTFSNYTPVTAYVHGGRGNDELHAGEGEVHVWGGLDDDRLYSGEHSYGVYDGGHGVDRICGGPNTDVIFGGAGGDFLFGFGGRDYIYGEVGDDVINGGDGDDELSGGFDNDLIFGGRGVDHLYGYYGNDDLNGGMDADYLFGDVGFDHLYGGGGYAYDYLNGGDDADVFWRDAGTFDLNENPYVLSQDQFDDVNPSEGDVLEFRNGDMIWTNAAGVSFTASRRSGGVMPARSADAPLDEPLFDEPVLEVPSWAETYMAELNAQILEGLILDGLPSATDADESRNSLVDYLQSLDLGFGVVIVDQAAGDSAAGDDGLGSYDDLDNYFGEAGDEAADPVDEPLDENPTTWEDVDAVFGESDLPGSLSTNGITSHAGLGGW